MSVLARSILDNAQDGQSYSGIVLVRNFSQSMTKSKNPKPYLDGVFSAGKDYSFKVWSGGTGLLEKMVAEDCSGKVCNVTVTAQSYQGNISFIMSACKPTDEFKPEDFLPIKYNKQSYVTALKDFMGKVLSKEGYAFLDEFLLSNEDLMNRFTEEFCAKSHHDNCKSGLLAHSFKVLTTAHFYLTTYPYLKSFNPRPMKVESYQSDLFYLGAFLHDVGKVDEMHMGVYQPNTMTSHRYLGVEMLSKYKDKIIAIYDTKWYYDLVAIMLQHHNKYADPATTIFSLIVHLADMSDSTLTSICDTIENSTNNDNAGAFIWYDGSRLFL